MYCWSTEYPEEEAILLDGTAIAPPAPPAPLEGTGNGAEERAAFIDAFLETLPSESVAAAPNAARGVAESAIDARGPSWKMWRAGIAYIRSVLEGGNHA